MVPEAFDVWQYFDDDLYEKSLARADADAAVKHAIMLTRSVGAKLGTLHAVQVVDRDDCTVFLWKYDKGVVFPTEEDMQSSG